MTTPRTIEELPTYEPLSYEELTNVCAKLAVLTSDLLMRLTMAEGLIKSLTEQANFLTEQILSYRAEAQRFELKTDDLSKLKIPPQKKKGGVPL